MILSARLAISVCLPLLTAGTWPTAAQELPASPTQSPSGASDPQAVFSGQFSPLAPKLVPTPPGSTPNDGQVRLRLMGQPAKSYLIETSTNLTDWTSVATNRTNLDGTFDFVVLDRGQAGPRYYRAVLLAADAIPLATDFFRPTRILVKPKPGIDLTATHALLGAQVVRAFGTIGNLQVVKIPAGRSVDAIILGYRETTLVEYAEPDYILHVASSPNDFRFADGSLWGLHNTGQMGGVADADIDAPEAWDIRNSAGDVIVAVIDTGIRYTHEDLAANMWVNPGEKGGSIIALDKSVNRLDDDGDGYVDDVHGINAILGTGDPFDDHGHGTHVSGIIGAVDNNGVGVVGVAWQVRLMACKSFDARGEGAVSDAITCIDYARSHGAKIINASWGSPSFQSAGLRDAIASAGRAGILFVTSAGNSAQNNDLNPSFPASYDLDNIVVVAATDRADQLAFFSNFGAASVDLGAPGYVIFSTWNATDRDYRYLNGTSMAAAYVSGACALLRAHYASESVGQIKDRLLAGVDPLPALANKTVTGGRLNLRSALTGTRPFAGVTADFAANPASGSVPLTVRFTDQSSGDVAQWDWNFGDGTGPTAERNPAHVYQSAGTFAATLTVTGANGSTSRKSQTISATSPAAAAPADYQIQQTTFDWFDPNATPALALADDGVSGAQSLPFDFVFYGQTYRQFFVGANGLLGFTTAGLGSAANTDLPNGGAPNGMIAPFWADLNPGAGGQVRAGVVGAAPARQAVVSWVDVPIKSGALIPSRFTFQAVLSEGSSRIRFQYLQIEPNRLLGEKQTGTVGIENESGRAAAKYAYRENPATLANRQALLFIPPQNTLPPPPPTGPCADDAGRIHYPDLIALRPDELAIVVENNRKLLRFSNTSANLGDGPLEVFPQNNSSGTTEAFQRLYTHDANCNWRPASTNFVGTFAFHPEHDHWHFENFARYELRNVAANGNAGSTVLANSAKVSFCLGDTVSVNPGLKHAAPQTFTQCDQTHPQGISVGWGDIYQWYLPGQSLDITGLANGDYWLLTTVDPSGLLNEGGGAAETNNANAVKIHLEGNRVSVTQ